VECGPCGGDELLGCAVGFGGIFGHRVRWRIDVDDVWFGFVRGEGATDAIFVVRWMQEKFRAKGKRLCSGFVDLKMAFEWTVRTFSYRSFTVVGPRICNSLPTHLRDEDITYNNFRHELKAFWF